MLRMSLHAKWKWLYQIRQYTAHLVDQSRMSVMYILFQSSKKSKGKKANFYQKRTEEAMIVFSKTLQIALEKNIYAVRNDVE